MLNLRLQQKLLEYEQHCLLRYQPNIEAINGNFLTHAGQQYLSFSSNNYLGLAQHPEVIKACQAALKYYGVGSGSAYLITGHMTIHKELEEELAHFLQYPKVLLFSSGYLANLGVIRTLFSKGDAIFADKLNHASLLDGCLSSQATFKRYSHNNIAALQTLCSQTSADNKLIVTEGLFGMNGDYASLDKIVTIAERHKAILLVDDAHAVGVIGKSGRGTLEKFQLSSKEVPILVGTLGKAFGSYGAFVASSPLIIESLLQMTRTYIYTTAIPPAIAAASLASLRLIQKETWRRERLAELIAYFKTCAQQLNLPCSDSATPIQPIMLGCNQKVLATSEKLLAKGIYLKAIRPPTVPKNQARLRISITVDHTKQQLDFLLESLAHVIHNKH